MYWPFATEILFAGCALLVFIAFPLYAYHMYKDHQHISNGFIFTAIVLVWFVIPKTLISINLSRDIIRNAYEINQSMGKDLVFLQETNDAITAEMKDNPLAVGVAEQADKLVIFIEDLKNGIKKNEMPGGIETGLLTELVNEFENQSLSVSPDAQ
jgi:SpoU rRNA methylase family enzyme